MFTHDGTEIQTHAQSLGFKGRLLNRSGAIFRSEGSPLNPKDLLQIYVILAVGACVLCQSKVCCDVC